MNNTHVTRLLVLLAVATFAFAGCNSGTTNTNNAANTANSNTATNTANKDAKAPGTTGDFSTPTATFKAFYDAAKANNIDGIKRAISKKTLETMTTQAAKDNKSVDDMLKEIVKDAPANAPEVRNEKIDGDKATIEMKDDKMAAWATVPFVKEDGLWKIAMAEDKSAAADAAPPEKK